MLLKPIRWIRTGSELYRIIDNSNHNYNASFVSLGLRPLRANQTGNNLKFFI